MKKPNYRCKECNLEFAEEDGSWTFDYGAGLADLRCPNCWSGDLEEIKVEAEPGRAAHAEVHV